MIDFDLPIRSVRTQTRLYVVGREREGARLDLRKDSHFKSGILYGYDGMPVDEHSPMGPVENFDDSPFTAIIDVKEEELERLNREAVQRFNAKVQEELGESELFGLF